MKGAKLVVVLTIALLILTFNSGHALENLKGMNIQSAGMGFVGVSDPFKENNIFSIDNVYTNLFGLGLTFNSYRVSYFSQKFNLSLGAESLYDNDIVEPLRYHEKGYFAQINYRLSDFISIETISEYEKYELEEKKIGNGLVNNFKISFGPLTSKYGDYSIGIGTGIIWRKFNSGREEKRWIEEKVNVMLTNKSSNLSVQLSKLGINFGVEYHISNNITLRGGFNGKEPTFGLRLRLKRFNFEYAYWLAEAGATQFFGSNFSF